VLSDYFEFMCDNTELFTWPQAYLPLLAHRWIFDVTIIHLKPAQIPARSSLGQVWRSRAKFIYFFRLPHELRDLVYEFASESESGYPYGKEINVVELIYKIRQFADVPAVRMTLTDVDVLFEPRPFFGLLNDEQERRGRR
jgi:hypothetical protein